ncbi:hypothetical protein Slin15195_G060280 [Septoria linicola]|uniref:Uncharacterized protein n=1 Tax=Septoria linicola TaxID=215465 RepID=A0A9Q9EJZ4_9PEZI|nr:hypothetical protein Slin15195_G060280 [Septoria linicola]
MLSLSLASVDTAIEDVDNQMLEAKPGTLSAWLDEMRSFIKDATAKLNNLNLIVKYFRAELEHHSQWLARFRSDVRADQVRDDHKASGTPHCEEHDELDQITGCQDPFCEDPKDWAKGCMAYLRLVCLHESSIQEETDWIPKEPPTVAGVRSPFRTREPQYTLVEFQQARLTGTRTKSINGCLDELTKEDSDLDKDVLRDMLGRYTFSKQPQSVGIDCDLLNGTNSSGTVHFGTILLTLEMLAHKPELQQRLTQDWMHSNGISGDIAQLAELLKGFPTSAGASKHGCLACSEVSKAAAQLGFLSDSTSQRASIAGDCSRYHAMALPPFTPKDVAKKFSPV